MTDQTETAPFTPPAAEGLPPGVLDSATDGASALDAWARTPHGRNFLAHALVGLARDGWLRTAPCGGFEPVRDRETPKPETPGCGCPSEDAVEHQFGGENCDCVPFTRQRGASRHCQPGDTVDMISGWEIGSTCPHHRYSIEPKPAAARPKGSRP